MAELLSVKYEPRLQQVAALVSEDGVRKVVKFDPSDYPDGKDPLGLGWDALMAAIAPAKESEE